MFNILKDCDGRLKDCDGRTMAMIPFFIFTAILWYADSPKTTAQSLTVLLPAALALDYQAARAQLY